MNNIVSSYLKSHADIIEKEGPKIIGQFKDCQPRLIEAMLYSYTAGGKRLRPSMMFASYELFGGKAEDIIPAAVSLEMLQTYSLIHDDLPCIDNDDIRRGKPSSHKVFGEALALLAGDALFGDSFTVMLNGKYPQDIMPRLAGAAGILARRAGAQGMISGQVLDKSSEGFLLNPQNMSIDDLRKEGLRRLEYIQLHKTADLFMMATEIGTFLAGASAEDFKHMSDFGLETGLCLQISDDILDVTADRKKLGKSSNDAEKGKLTYVTLFGLDGAKEHLDKHYKAALSALDKVNGDKQIKAVLSGIAEYICVRDL